MLAQNNIRITGYMEMLFKYVKKTRPHKRKEHIINYFNWVHDTNKKLVLKELNKLFKLGVIETMGGKVRVRATVIVKT